MESTLNETRRSLALFLLIAVFSTLSAAQLQFPKDPSNIKDLNELGAQYLPAGYSNSNVTVADLQRLLRQKCEKANSGLPANQVDAGKLSGNIEQAAGQLFQCVSGLLNVTAMLDEVEDAKPKGDLDVVFERYCLRLPNMTQCLNDFNAALLPCLTREERNHNAMMKRIVGKLLDFVCFRNGDQIALFIAEQGPECFEEHKDNIGNCFQTNFGHYLPSELNVTKLELPELVLDSKKCLDLHNFETCVLGHLEKCENITPSNIVESMFRYVRKETNCQQSINRETRESEPLSLRAGASVSSVATAAATLALPLALVLRTF
ncbi:27 kDa glycoprotein [Drosophila nasuta]|uniref:27 kDa glycoprotein n=1 Tax=Drosophila nasuta TaxID=42062 RepID=UPI00295E406E|nr:27 kDa glycoprotein [Drosophila nasuta]